MKFDQRGSGPTVVLVSGLGCDGRMWDPIASRLEERFTVILPETWGCGSLHAAAQAIKTILEDRGVFSACVAGLSMGGYITFELLRHWPQRVKSAAFLSTTAFPDTPEREEQRCQVLRLIREGKYSEVLDAFVPSTLSPSRALEGPARETMFAMGQALGAEVFASDTEAILRRGSYEDVLPLLRVPVLFVAGEHDTMTSVAVARAMAADVPSARVETVPDAGHMTPLENPDRVADLLVDFFGMNFESRRGEPTSSLEGRPQPPPD